MDQGDKKKRKMEENINIISYANEEENEEEKMEKFFALLKSSRELKERLAIRNSQSHSKKSDNEKAAAAAASAWNPAFLFEDFEPSPPTPQAGNECAEAQKAGPSSKTKDEDKNGDEVLDLNLSL
ncbi:uncharacterized protein LOC142527924 [Primulina tabacum]|uniref:uncharacterized protein LOC142527924 n=1 Tax=Primulina tabacum TaxID=48773 RepID=UPI003F59C02D